MKVFARAGSRGIHIPIQLLNTDWYSHTNTIQLLNQLWCDTYFLLQFWLLTFFLLNVFSFLEGEGGGGGGGGEEF